MGRTACTEPQCLYKDALYIYQLQECASGFSRLTDKGSVGLRIFLIFPTAIQILVHIFLRDKIILTKLAEKY